MMRHDRPAEKSHDGTVTWFFPSSGCLLLMHADRGNPRMTSTELSVSSRICATNKHLAPSSPLLPFLLPFLPSSNCPHMTRRLPPRPDPNPSTRKLPLIKYRHILAPTPFTPAKTLAMERTSYPSHRRPSFGPRRSTSHVTRRDPSDFADSQRTLAVRPRYPDRAKSTVGVPYDAGIRSSVIYCPPQRPGLRQTPMPGPYIGDGFAGLDDLPRRAEVYEVPVSYASDLDGTRSRSSAQTSRPSSRGSEYVYTEYEDDEERERKRFLGSELYGYVMALRLKERLVDVRQVLNLYKDFDRASGCKCYHP